MALTESGQRCHGHTLEILIQYRQLVDNVMQIKARPEEMIRIGCSLGFGRNHIAPAITELIRNYPELQVRFELFDRQIDLVQGSIDLDTRINDAVPNYYIAHLLTKNKRILYAVPEYLQKYPQLQSLQELNCYDCLVTKERDMAHEIWELGNGQERRSVRVNRYLSPNSGEIVLQRVLESKGIMLRSGWDVLPFLEGGKLVRVLPGYTQSVSIWVVYREPLYRSVKLRVCVEFLAAWCRQWLGKPDKGYQIMQIRQEPLGILFALSFELRPDFCLLMTPQTLDVVMMTRQDQAREHRNREGEL